MKKTYAIVPETKADWYQTAWGFIVKHEASNLVAAVAGIVIGIIVKYHVDPSTLAGLIDFPEELFVRLMQMISIPFIASSVMTGVAEIPVNIPKKMFRRATVYFSLTTLVAIITGISLPMLLEPGADFSPVKDEGFTFFSFHCLLDFISKSLPNNVMKDIILKFPSKLSEDECTFRMNDPSGHLVRDYVGIINAQYLILNFCLLGMILRTVGEMGSVVFRTMGVVYKVSTKLVSSFTRVLPPVILLMTVDYVINVHDCWDIYRLGKFVFVFVLGLITYGVVLAIIYLLLTKSNPWTVIQGVSPELKAAFICSSPSSSATLQLTLQYSERTNRIDPTVSRFMLPIGSRVNRIGSTLYGVAAAVFTAQLSHYNLSLTNLIKLGMVVPFLSAGPAGMPVTGPMPTIFAMTALGLPVRDVAILVVVEWLLAHCINVVNVLGDCIGAALVDALSKEELGERD